MALKAAKLEGRVEVIDFEETSEHFAPGFMVAVDYEVRSEGFRSTSCVCRRVGVRYHHEIRARVDIVYISLT